MTDLVKTDELTNAFSVLEGKTEKDEKWFWETLKRDYTEEYDWLVSLVRGFRNHNAPYVFVDSRRQRHQIESAQFATTYGLLKEEILEGDQYSQWRYYLTDLGERVLKSRNAPDKYSDS